MRNLVFLPGWTKDKNSYKYLIESAPSGVKVFIPSYDYLAPYKGLSHFERQVFRLLDDNNLDEIELAGHSFGGKLAIYFASRHPERLKKLYLIDSMVSAEKLSKIVENAFRERIKINPYLNILVLIDIFKKPILSLKSAFLALGLNVEGELKKIQTPTILIWAENDILIPLDNAKIIQENVRNTKLIILKGTDHDWITHSPEYFWKNIT